MARLFGTDGVRGLANGGLTAGLALDREALHDKVHAALLELRRGGGSSQCPGRVLLMTEPPNADAGEITDKGYINQRAVLERRAALVEKIYTVPPPAEGILPGG